MENENHLPFFGVGPYLVIPMLAITIALIIYPDVAKLNFPQLDNILIVTGVLFLILGAILWIMAMMGSKINENIKENKLVTTGIYSYVRHPIYACFLYVNIGLVLISTNIYLFALPVVYWIFLSVVISRTEERWLLELYGDEYRDYSKRVNRFFTKLEGDNYGFF